MLNLTLKAHWFYEIEYEDVYIKGYFCTEDKKYFIYFLS